MNDRPRKEIERIRGRMFELDLDPSKAVVLADDRADGGLKIEIHPLALAELKKFGLSVDEVLEAFRGLRYD